MEEVKVLLAHQFEDLKANPELETACSEEIKKLCAQEKVILIPASETSAL